MSVLKTRSYGHPMIWPDFTGVRYVIELQQCSCKHPHRCNQTHFLTPGFTLLSVFIVFFVIERKGAQHIFTYSSIHREKLQVRSAGIFFSWTVSRRAELVSRHSATLVRPRYCRLLHWVIWWSNDDSTTVFYSLCSTTEILSTIFYCRCCR